VQLTIVMKATKTGKLDGHHTRRPSAVERMGSGARLRQHQCLMTATLASTTGNLAGLILKNIGAVCASTVAAHHTTAKRAAKNGKRCGMKANRLGAAQSKESAARRQLQSHSIAKLVLHVGKWAGLRRRRRGVVTTTNLDVQSMIAKKALPTGSRDGLSTRRAIAALEKVWAAHRLLPQRRMTVWLATPTGNVAGPSIRSIGAVHTLLAAVTPLIALKA